MKQKDLITYGLIGLAVYFLFLKKEDTETTEDTGSNGPELATNKGPANKEPDAVFKDGSNTDINDPSEFMNTSR
jgi:hypothetical protein